MDYIPRCAAMTTVSPTMAAAYADNFQVRPEVIYSAPPFQELPVQFPNSDCIRLIYHGAANPDRRLEDMISMMDLLDERFTLDLMLIGKGKYLHDLRNASVRHPRIRWKDPVPMAEICEQTNQYDIGIFIMPPTTFNLQVTIPNKFFEFVQARLAVAVGPSEGMGRLTKEYGLGIVSADFTGAGMATKLNALTVDDIVQFKHNADVAARVLNAQSSMKIMSRLIEQILSMQHSSFGDNYDNFRYK